MAAGTGRPSPDQLAMGKRWARIGSDFAVEHGIAPGSDMLLVVERLGGEVAYVNRAGSSTPSIGEIEVSEKGTFTIELSPYSSALRDRVAIAHNIGHYQIHAKSNGIDRNAVTRFNHRANTCVDEVSENEANWFANGLLMPEAEFLRTYDELRGNMLRVTWHFDVPYSFAKIRAASLGLV